MFCKQLGDTFHSFETTTQFRVANWEQNLVNLLDSRQNCQQQEVDDDDRGEGRGGNI
jgi:hypothetical protein